MKPLIGLFCLLTVAAFAGTHGGGHVGGGRVGGGGAARPSPGRERGAAHNAGRGRYGLYGGYGLGGSGYWGDYGPSYDSGYYPPAVPASGPMVSYPQAAASMAEPPVHPVIHEYGRPEDYGTPAEGDNSPVLYLIALRDKTIHAASTYWVQDESIHYLDTDHKEQRAPLAAVDRELSARLNRERHVPFALQ